MWIAYIQYQGEMDPNKHYFNQLAHHLIQRSNYYSEESFSKLIRQKGISSEDFSIVHTNIRRLTMKQCSPCTIYFFYLYLNYCFHVWVKAYDTHLHHLIVLQNKDFALYIYSHYKWYSSTNQCGQFLWCIIFNQWNIFTLTMLDYSCVNIQTKYSLMY